MKNLLTDLSDRALDSWYRVATVSPVMTELRSAIEDEYLRRDSEYQDTLREEEYHHLAGSY